MSVESTELDERDRADMQRLASGHEAALNDLMGRHGPKLFNYLIRCCAGLQPNHINQRHRAYNFRRPGLRWKLWRCEQGEAVIVARVMPVVAHAAEVISTTSSFYIWADRKRLPRIGNGRILRSRQRNAFISTANSAHEQSNAFAVAPLAFKDS